ncbi:MAG: hypothetical protein ACJ8AW_07200 [Rhodopila sp.]
MLNSRVGTAAAGDAMRAATLAALLTLLALAGCAAYPEPTYNPIANPGYAPAFPPQVPAAVHHDPGYAPPYPPFAWPDWRAE